MLTHTPIHKNLNKTAMSAQLPKTGFSSFVPKPALQPELRWLENVFIVLNP
jgi:hypothetical protein